MQDMTAITPPFPPSEKRKRETKKKPKTTKKIVPIKTKQYFLKKKRENYKKQKTNIFSRIIRGLYNLFTHKSKQP